MANQLLDAGDRYAGSGGMNAEGVAEVMNRDVRLGLLARVPPAVVQSSRDTCATEQVAPGVIGR